MITIKISPEKLDIPYVEDKRIYVSSFAEAIEMAAGFVEEEKDELRTGKKGKGIRRRREEERSKN